MIGAADVQRELTEQKAFVTQSAVADPTLLAIRSREPPAPSATNLPSAVRPLREEVRRAEQRAIEKALRGAKGNRARAARMLGISRRTLYTKLEEHGFGSVKDPDAPSDS